MSEPGSLKQRIKAGEVITGIGASMDATRGQLEAILAHRTCDFFNIDSQHGPFSEEKLVAFCATAEALDIPVHFRIKHTRHTYLIGNILDLGPTGIVVPQVEAESTVIEALDAFYYPQKGKRSWGGGARRGIGHRPDRLDYAAWWNDYGVLWLQLESVDAIVNCRKLAKPGVDMLTFGPNDLLYSLEGYQHAPFSDVDDCIRHVVAEMKGADVGIGLSISNIADRDRYIAMGINVIMEP